MYKDAIKMCIRDRGTAGIEKEDTKEIDITLGYATGGFSISVTDYWFNGGPGYFHYGSHNTNHTFEAQIGYDLEMCIRDRLICVLY